MIRFLRFAALAAIACGVLAIPFLKSTAVTSDATVAVIVQLRDEPGAVYQARAEKSGGAVSTDQLQAYRQQVAGSQSSGSSPTGPASLPKVTAVMRFTANPLTKQVTTQIVSLK